MTSEIFMHLSLNPASNFFTLADVGRPDALCTLMTERGHGLGVISGTDRDEIQKTMAALAQSFVEAGWDVTSLRVGDAEPLPGVTEIHSNDITSAGRTLARMGFRDVMLMDSLDTKEKLTFAVEAAVVGGLVIAPVMANSASEAIQCLVGNEYGVNEFLVNDALVYVAHQTAIEDVFSARPDTFLSVDVTVMNRD